MTKTTEPTPLVSVVIPTYERSEYLEGAIKTALGQTYDNIEIVVVDDGSSNQYADKIAAEFSGSVKCVRHEENKGLSAARNTGIRESNGEYIAFLDDDDRWHKMKIARQVSALEKDATAGLATCLVVSITPENEIVHCERSAPSGDCSDEILINNKIGTPSRVLVRQECFEEIGVFDESLPTKQDWDFYLRLCQEWNVTAVEDHLCFRVIHDSMSSSSSALERDKNTILEKHEKRIRNSGLWKQAKAAVSEEIGRSYLDEGELRKARNYLHQSLMHFSIRRLVLTLLSYTHPIVIQNSIRLKRTLAQYNCKKQSIPSIPIPGLNS
ncbi:glycosyltransferase family 2 protein [Halobacterium salinarum]|uniref:glycosyltransferase family 2 protein n=1 Tax=Halobacterium salinarum TaxID=2242 RepID=UPI002555BC0C|nr:glycosyltransferase family 2 protein [Halobacterium salinarum]MDL0132508.1 glycosyltransferase family 2 protein [Halobacterium salinarum]